MFQGNTLSLKPLKSGFVELNFNAQQGSVNIFNQATLMELLEALSLLSEKADIKGLLLTSGKSVFVAGADITEFGEAFKGSEADRRKFLAPANEAFNRIEASMVLPSVAVLRSASPVISG